jgi:hypothetical protein
MPGAVVVVGVPEGGGVGVAGGAVTGAIGVVEKLGVVTTAPGAGVGAAAGFEGGELSGAPTAMSQRWPGCPCGGFMPGAVAVPCGTGAGEGDAGIIVPASVTGTCAGVVVEAGSDDTGAAMGSIPIVVVESVAVVSGSEELLQPEKINVVITRSERIFFMVFFLVEQMYCF